MAAVYHLTSDVPLSNSCNRFAGTLESACDCEARDSRLLGGNEVVMIEG